MSYYVVIDTNVLISALIKLDSNPGTILRMVAVQLVTPVYNNEILKEYENVMKRKKIKFSNWKIEYVTNLIKKNGVFIDGETINIEFIDEKDRIFYEVCMSSNSINETRLVTGNIKHFPKDSVVLTPKEFCELVLHDYPKIFC